MNNKIEFRNKIYHGIKTAIERLIISRAKDDEFLIVSKEGKIVKIPAKEIKRN